MRNIKATALKLTLGFMFLFGIFSASGQLVSSTAETLVNTTTTDSTQQNCAVSMDTLGRYVVVWESEGGDGDGFGIFAKIYNADHTVRVAEFQVNTSAEADLNDQRFPDVAMNAEGIFCVVWQSRENEGDDGFGGWNNDGWDCYRKIFDVDGVTVSLRSRMNSSLDGNQMHPAVAAGDDRFVVTWASEVAGENEFEIKERYFLSTGVNLASPTVVHTSIGNHMTNPDVAMSATGEYVFTWQVDSLDGDRSGVYCATYNNSYTQIVAPTVVNTTTAGNQQEPRVAMDENGEFMIVWSSFDQDGDHFGIYGQRFSTGGAPSGGEIAINSTTANSQDHVAIAVTREGGKYLISWTDDFADGDAAGVYTRTMYSNGSFIASDAIVNTTTTEYQNFSDVAIGSDNTEAVYAWQSGINHGSTSLSDPSYYGIYSQGFVIDDITPPVANCANLTVYLDASGNVSILPADVDGGSTDNVGIVNMTLSTSDYTCANLGSNSTTLTVFDAAGLSDACASGVTVLDTISPTAVCQDITVYLDGAGNAIWGANDLDAGSTDNCSTVTLTADMVGANCSEVGANTVTLTVTDGSGNTNTCTSTVTVLDTISPSAVCQNITVYLDGTGNATIAGSDMDGGSSDNCAGSLAVTADITVFTCSEIGTNSVTLTVTDPGGNSNNCSAIVTLLDTISPTIVCQDITVYLDGTGNTTITSADVDGGSSDNCGVLTLGIDLSAFTCSMTGANTVTLTGTDASGNSNMCTATVTVLDTISPTAVCQNITVYLDGTGNVSIAAADVGGGSSDNCSVALTADITSFTCANTGANSVVLTVTDPSGNTSNCTSTVTVLDTISPTAVCQNLTIYLDASGSATISSTDVDGGSTDNCGAPVVTINTSTFDCSNIGANTVTVTATDASGNTDGCTSTVTILDTISPTIVCQDITVYLDGTGNATITSADVDGGSSDNCGVPTLGIDLSAFTCSMTGANTVTLTATDASGNTDVCTSTVTVMDTITPTASCQNTTVYLDGVGNASIVAADIDNGSTDNCTFGLAVDITSFTCAEIGANTVVLTVTDAAGNFSTCISTVTVADTISPTASNLTALNVECIGDAPNDITLITDEADNCSIPVVAFVGDVSDGLTCPETITRSYSVSDGSGNSINVTQSITVLDITPPTASNPLDLNVQCTVEIPAPVIGWVTDESDNCGVPLVAWVSDVSDGLSCPETITRTFSVSDICGNTINLVQMIIVLDIDAPTADITTLTELTGNCDITPPAATATDNCSGVLTGVPDVPFPITAVGTTLITWTYTDDCGNVSTQTQDVTITAIDVSTEMASDNITIVASNSTPGITYQWIDCNTGQMIPGETNHNYTPTYGSNFAVIITQNGCSDTSACVASTVGIDPIDIDLDLELVVFPNPTTNGNFSIQLKGEWNGEVKIELVDTRGRLIYSKTTNEKIILVELEKLQSGTYFIRAKDEQENALITRLVTVID